MIKAMMSKELYRAFDSSRSKDKTRILLTGYHITKKYVEVTDGRMLLRANRELIHIPEGTKLGVYKIIGTEKVKGGLITVTFELMEGEYPDTESVVPKDGKESESISVPILPEKKEVLSLSRAIIKLYQHTGNAYSVHLLKNLSSLEECWAIDKAGKDMPIKATVDNTYIAVILPFQI